VGYVAGAGATRRPKFRGYYFSWRPDQTCGLDWRPGEGEMRREKPLRPFAHNLRRGQYFFIFFARNPLKSPESARKNKKMQANLLGFIWIFLHLFAEVRAPGCI
jgi:hypothetical protein